MPHDQTLKPAPGRWIVFTVRHDVFSGYVKGVTLSGNCYCAGYISTIKSHQIIDVVNTQEEYISNKDSGKYYK